MGEYVLSEPRRDLGFWDLVSYYFSFLVSCILWYMRVTRETSCCREQYSDLTDNDIPGLGQKEFHLFQRLQGRCKLDFEPRDELKSSTKTKLYLCSSYKIQTFEADCTENVLLARGLC